MRQGRQQGHLPQGALELTARALRIPYEQWTKMQVLGTLPRHGGSGGGEKHGAISAKKGKVVHDL